MDGEALVDRIVKVKRLYSSGSYAECKDLAEASLSDAADFCTEVGEAAQRGGSRKGGLFLSDLHLIVAKCLLKSGDTKAAISACNSAILALPDPSAGPAGEDRDVLIREPYLVRTACFEAWRSWLLRPGPANEDQDDPQVQRDWSEAAIVLDCSYGPDGAGSDWDKPTFADLGEALRSAPDGAKIFVKPGTYRVRPGSAFLMGKGVSLMGSSAKDCVFLFGADNGDDGSQRSGDKAKGQQGHGGGQKGSRETTQSGRKTTNENRRDSLSSNLNTFLICGGSGKKPTVLRRLTFRAAGPKAARVRYVGVAAGPVQAEDCVFEGVAAPDQTGEAVDVDVDAVYVSAKICGALAKHCPPPSFTARFCVFASCGSVIVARGVLALRSCLLVNSGVIGMDSAKVVVEDCEFSSTHADVGGKFDSCSVNQGQTRPAGGSAVVSCTSSDLSVLGCYVHGGRTGQEQVVGISLKSVAELAGNYFCVGKDCSGVSCSDSDLVVRGNIIMGCRRLSTSPVAGAGPFRAGVQLIERSKAQIVDNLFLRCDVGVHAGRDSAPLIRANRFSGAHLAGVFADLRSRPNVVQNTFINNVKLMPEVRSSGLGLLWIGEAAGLIGKNEFRCFRVCPVMIFTRCHPLLKGNAFEEVEVNEAEQKLVEETMLLRFKPDLFRLDEYFYMVYSEATEKELQEVILKGEVQSPPDEASGPVSQPAVQVP